LLEIFRNTRRNHNNLIELYCKNQLYLLRFNNNSLYQWLIRKEFLLFRSVSHLIVRNQLRTRTRIKLFAIVCAVNISARHIHPHYQTFLRQPVISVHKSHGESYANSRCRFKEMLRSWFGLVSSSYQTTRGKLTNIYLYL